MKARIQYQKNNEKRTIVLRDNSLLIIFHNLPEAENTYHNLKEKMRRAGWKPVPEPISKKINSFHTPKRKITRVFGLPLKEGI